MTTPRIVRRRVSAHTEPIQVPKSGHKSCSGMCFCMSMNEMSGLRQKQKAGDLYIAGDEMPKINIVQFHIVQIGCPWTWAFAMIDSCTDLGLSLMSSAYVLPGCIGDALALLAMCISSRISSTLLGEKTGDLHSCAEDTVIGLPHWVTPPLLYR